MNVAYNIDCMEYMKTLPDNAFELAVVDPPYGDAQQEQEFREQGAHFVGRGRSKRYVSGEAADTHTHTHREPWNRFGGRFDKYKQTAPLPRRGQMEQILTTANRERERENVTRTGGTWAEKYGKKS